MPGDTNRGGTAPGILDSMLDPKDEPRPPQGGRLPIEPAKRRPVATPVKTEGEEKKKKKATPEAWQEARALVWRHRRHLTIGLALTLVSRMAGLVLPASPKFVIDRVIGESRGDLLLPLALVVAGATFVQAAGSFALSQVISIT